MELATMVMTAVGLSISLIVIVGTVVWAVAQIKETTSNLSLEIKHLAESVTKLNDGHDDHEERIRRIEYGKK
jgi:prefoldin subunit 5